MVRTACLAAAALALAACEPGASSSKPLLAEGPHPMREGLWALLAEGCAAPSTTAVSSWRSCAMPVWVAPDTVSYIALGRITGGMRWADGDPALIQLSASPAHDAGPPPWLGIPDQSSKSDLGHGYFVARGEGGRPYTRGRVWQAPCPRTMADDAGEDRCEVSSLAELRAVAAEAVRAAPGYRAVWIAAD